MAVIKPPKIYAAMLAINEQVEAIKKERQNTEQKFMFRGIEDMYNALHPLFSSNRVLIASKILDRTREQKLSKTGTVGFIVCLTIEFRFIAEDGSFITSEMEGEGADFGDKATAKAVSMALKSMLQQMFLIPTKDMVDGDKDSPQMGEATAKVNPVAPANQSQPAIKLATDELPEDVENEIYVYTESDALSEWANGQKAWHRNANFLRQVQTQIDKLREKEGKPKIERRAKAVEEAAKIEPPILPVPPKKERKPRGSAKDNPSRPGEVLFTDDDDKKGAGNEAG